MMCAHGISLKGGVAKEYIPEGFFGSWGVISKMQSSNNPTAFNFESRDIWMLSGHGNILILENLESGAKSEIVVNEKSIDGKTLKFKRTKEVKLKNGRDFYTEIVEFKLQGDAFSGTDIFKIERFNQENKKTKTDEATYIISGVKISSGQFSQ